MLLIGSIMRLSIEYLARVAGRKDNESVLPETRVNSIMV